MHITKSCRATELAATAFSAALHPALQPCRALRSLRGEQVPDGLELLLSSAQSRQAFFDTLRGAHDMAGGGESFVLLHAPLTLDLADVALTARLAAEAGLEDSLCVAVSRHHPAAAALMAALQHAGLRCAVADVDADTRLSEVGTPEACALVLDGGFIGRAYEDLRTHTLLQSVVGLGADLGLISIAPPPLRGNASLLSEIGVDYVGWHAPVNERARFSGTSFGAPLSDSPAGYRGARYGQ